MRKKLTNVEVLIFIKSVTYLVHVKNIEVFLLIFVFILKYLGHMSDFLLADYIYK